MPKVLLQILSIALWVFTAYSVVVALGAALGTRGGIGIAIGVGVSLLAALTGYAARGCWRAAKAPALQPGEPDPTASVRPWRDR